MKWGCLNKLKKKLLRKIFDTGKGCPIYQLYFESGHLPARIKIKRMKLVFYQYLLKQDETSLLFSFLMAQKAYPRKGDWYSEVQTILKEFEILCLKMALKKPQLNTSKSWWNKNQFRQVLDTETQFKWTRKREVS